MSNNILIMVHVKTLLSREALETLRKNIFEQCESGIIVKDESIYRIACIDKETGKIVSEF